MKALAVVYITESLTQRPTARALTLLTHYTRSYCCVCVYVITNMSIWTLIYDFNTVIIGEVVPKLGSAPLHLPYTLENLFKYPFGHLVCMYVHLGNRYAHFSVAWSSAKIIKFACCKTFIIPSILSRGTPLYSGLLSQFDPLINVVWNLLQRNPKL